ncbi:MAG: alpha/beta hydrolase [Pseudomonadota bacterium]
MRLLIIGAALAALLGGVALAAMPMLLAIANSAKLSFEGGTAPDIVFDRETGLKLDVYTPPGERGDPKPVVVFFYGGSWQWGDRGDYPFVGVTLANEGFVTVVPDYRKYPDVQFPGFLEDGATAVAWVQKNISNLGGDPERIYLMGHSAGAHIAALLGTDERYLAEAVVADALRGVIGLAGPYRFTPTSDKFRAVFGNLDDFAPMKATTFADGSEPPMLLLHGLDDGIVEAGHTSDLSKVIRASGGCAVFKFYPDMGHYGIMGAFSWVFRESKPVVRDVVEFLRATDGGDCPS